VNTVLANTSFDANASHVPVRLAGKAALNCGSGVLALLSSWLLPPHAASVIEVMTASVIEDFFIS
jgi:hypothetical protein